MFILGVHIRTALQKGPLWTNRDAVNTAGPRTHELGDQLHILRSELGGMSVGWARRWSKGDPELPKQPMGILRVQQFLGPLV